MIIKAQRSSAQASPGTFHQKTLMTFLFIFVYFSLFKISFAEFTIWTKHNRLLWNYYDLIKWNSIVEMYEMSRRARRNYGDSKRWFLSLSCFGNLLESMGGQPRHHHHESKLIRAEFIRWKSNGEKCICESKLNEPNCSLSRPINEQLTTERKFCCCSFW